jgi:CarD family transcriptional regulator
MAARTKKTSRSGTKKGGSAGKAKAPAKRASKQTSASSARTRASKASKAKATTNARVSRKARQEKVKGEGTSKRTRKAVEANAAKKRASVVARKTAASKAATKATRNASAAKETIARPPSKGMEAKLRSKERAPEPHVATPVQATHQVPIKPQVAEPPRATSEEPASPSKTPTVAAKGAKSSLTEEAALAVKPPKPAVARPAFKLHEHVVYPAHGVGQIIAIEEQEVAGFKLELFVINFSKDKLTLRVPTSKVVGVGMRKISDPDAAKRSLDILTGRARVKRTMWSRRAQEYETKINSGDINAIAEVVRDLYRSDAQPEQSYSERQLYEAALDRMVREIAAVQKSNELDALKMVEAQLQKGQSRAAKTAGAPSEIEQAA